MQLHFDLHSIKIYKVPGRKNSPFANREIGRWRDLAMIYTNIETGLSIAAICLSCCMYARQQYLLETAKTVKKLRRVGVVCEAEGIVPKKHEHVSLLTSALRIQAGRQSPVGASLER